MSNSKYFSKPINDSLPEKDVKTSSSSSLSSSLTSRSHSCSSSGSTNAVSNQDHKSNMNQIESQVKHEEMQQESSSNPSKYYTKNQAINTNLLANRHYKSHFDLPMCNSTSIGSTSLSNRTLLPHTTTGSYLVNNTASLVNYPQTAHIPYSCHPFTQPFVQNTIFDRYLSNQYPNLTVNPPSLVDSYLTIHSNETLSQTHEIDRLKMKIALLEQQMSTKSIQQQQKQPNSTDAKLSNLEYEAAMLRLEINQEVSKDQQIEKLENMLNAKEYEIDELLKKHNEEKLKLEIEIVKQNELIKSNEIDISTEKTKLQQAKKENETLKSKLKELNDYIDRLPTLDEVDKKDKEHRDLKYEVEVLMNKLLEQEKKYVNAKQYIKEKNNQLKELKEVVDLANLERDKVQMAFEVYRNESKDVGELIQKAKQLAELTAENETNKKFINGLQDKLKAMQRNHDKEMSEIKEKLTNEMNLVISLEAKLASREAEMIKLEDSVKKISNQNQLILEEKLDLSEKLNTLNAAMSPETLKYLYSLFKELNFCVEELNELVSNCIDLHHGKPVDINSLLGYSRDNSYSSFDIEAKESGHMLSLIDASYLLNKTKEIQNCRVKLSDVRRLVSNEYAEKVGSNVSCITQ